MRITPASPPAVPRRLYTGSIQGECNCESYHQQKIQQLRRELLQHPCYDEQKHDDLWLLRFILSHKGNIRASTKAAQYTLEFRKTHALDEKDIRYEPCASEADFPAMRTYVEKCCGSDPFQFLIPAPHYHVVIGLIRFDALDMARTMEELPDKKSMLAVYLHLSEWSFQWTDYLTRTTGRMVRNVRLVDMTGFRPGRLHLPCVQRDAEIMRAMEDCYPQLLQSIFICHPPGWLAGVWSTVRTFMPRRVVDKFDMLRPTKRERDRKRLLALVGGKEDLLPTAFGGTQSEWPPRCPLPPKRGS